MCGIFTLLNNDVFSSHFVNTQFEKGKGRGPESSKLEDVFIKTTFGFHRLAINGLNEESNQPFKIHGISLICNGEIYNYRELYEMMGIKGETDSDCEVIIHLYEKYGMEQTLTMLDGVFAFVLCDYRNSSHDDPELNNRLFVARDPYGVRPLYTLSVIPSIKKNIYGFASELKCLNYLHLYEDGNKDEQKVKPITEIKQFIPGTYSEFVISNKIMSFWEPRQTNVIYHKPSFSYPLQYKKEDYSENLKYYCSTIQQILINAVNKRCLTTERPVACLLSGGLDSSLITALVNEFQKQHVFNKPLDSGFKKPLETYSIGLEGSIDLIYARKMADYLNTNHTEIIVTEQEMFDAIPEVIQAIESYDTTTVRASIGNYLLGKYIAKHSEAKVIFNGDGSDEVCGGYLYLKQCPDAIEFDRETRRLLKDIYLFDVLRSDKSISSHGLEPRTPFLDRSFVNHYLSIPPEFRFQTNQKRVEKYLLRESFSYDFFVNSEGYQLLPDEILWRRKEAFSDGVSSQGRSLFQILQEKSANELNKRNDYFNKGKVYEASLETEKIYYKSIFNKFYPLQESILPYFWMPKYTDAKDPSARTLDIYQKDDKE